MCCEQVVLLIEEEEEEKEEEEEEKERPSNCDSMSAVVRTIVLQCYTSLMWWVVHH